MALEPIEDEIPETDHGELLGRHATPRVRVFHREDTHDAYEFFHREECDEISNCVSSRRPWRDIFWTEQLDRNV